MHAHQRHHARDQPRRIAGYVIDVRQAVEEISRRLADQRHRNVAEAGVLRQHGQEGLDHARRETVADDDAVDVMGFEIFFRRLDAERADHADAFAHGDAERRIKRPAAGNQHGGILKRMADCSRAVSRSTGNEASLGRAIGTAASASASTRAMIGTIAPLAVAACRQSMRAADSLGGAPGSAMMMAAGLTEMKAVGASAQLVSMMGNAPARLRACTRSGAGRSATTMSGPCSDITPTRTG